jgi:hypothetical protein
MSKWKQTAKGAKQAPGGKGRHHIGSKPENLKMLQESRLSENKKY